MPASGPPAREGADIETLDGQVVGKARQLQTSQGCGVNGIDWNLTLIATMGECKKTSLRKQCKKAVSVIESKLLVWCNDMKKVQYPGSSDVVRWQGDQWKHVSRPEEKHLHRPKP